jgi:hypothetical protein
MVSPRALRDSFVVHPNEPFRVWLVAMFGVVIPARGTEVVRHPDDMGVTESCDVFNRWVAANVA